MADDGTPERDAGGKLDPAEERSRYFKKLETWLHEAYAWQSVAAMFPYYVMSGHVVNPTAGTKQARERNVVLKNKELKRAAEEGIKTNI